MSGLGVSCLDHDRLWPGHLPTKTSTYNRLTFESLNLKQPMCASLSLDL